MNKVFSNKTILIMFLGSIFVLFSAFAEPNRTLFVVMTVLCSISLFLNAVSLISLKTDKPVLNWLKAGRK